MKESTVDIIFAAVFVLAALTYLGYRIRKRIRSIRDSHFHCDCGCGCGGKKKLGEPQKK